MDWTRYQEVFGDVSKKERLRQQRLIAMATVIESEAGVEMDEYIARLLGQHLRYCLSNPRTDIARYVKRRDEEREGDAK